MATRQVSNLAYESYRGILSMAGARQISQSKVTINATSDNTYTVSSAATRRVVCVYGGAGAMDIRTNFGVAADGNSFPLLAQKYFVWDAEKGQVIHFYNTTAGALDVYVMEIE